MSHSPTQLPTPAQLFRKLESGEISRRQFHAAMRMHQEDLVDEMVESKLNPIVSFIDHRLCKSHATRLAKTHGEPFVREVLLALSEIPNFPPAQLTWNANHLDVPLYCFFRIKREPVFRILDIKPAKEGVTVRIEHGGAKKTTAIRERIHLHSNGDETLEVAGRALIS